MGIKKVVCVSLVLVTCMLAYYANGEYAVTQEIIDSVNNNPNAKWEAGHNEFSSMPLEDFVKRLLPYFPGEVPRHVSEEKSKEREESADKALKLGLLPESFSTLDKFGNCIHPIRNQGHCGSCWAFAASEVLSDRFCIFSDSTIDVILSPQDFVWCDKNDFGCDGATQLDNSWTYSSIDGLVTEECMPYECRDHPVVRECPTSCKGGEDWIKYRSISYRHMWDNQDAMMEMMSNGPIESSFTVYSDFTSYKSGVYHHTTQKILGGHAIKIVGWGVENDVPYWLVANSWNTTWGLNGFFKIARGVDECGIESGMITGYPDVAGFPRLDYVVPRVVKERNDGENHTVYVNGSPEFTDTVYNYGDVTFGGKTVEGIFSFPYRDEETAIFMGSIIDPMSCGLGNIGQGNNIFAAINGSAEKSFWFFFPDDLNTGVLSLSYNSCYEGVSIGFQLHMYFSGYVIANETGYISNFQKDVFVGKSLSGIGFNDPSFKDVSGGKLVDVSVKHNGHWYNLHNGALVVRGSLPGTPGQPYAINVTETSIYAGWAAP